MTIKKIASAMMLIGAFSTSNAAVCKQTPGSVTCGKGTVENLSGNGMVTLNGTTIEGHTHVNGMLTADEANFTSVSVNGSATFLQCTINQNTQIKGSLKASATQFEKSVDIFSNSIRLVNSTVRNNIQFKHTDQSLQEIYLDNQSEIGGDIIFEDGHGKVYLRGDSKIGGHVIGGKIINN